MNDFLKEQWHLQTSTLSFRTEHPPSAQSSSRIDIRRQASFPSYGRQVSKGSIASGRSDRTIVQKLLNRKAFNSSLPPSVPSKGKVRDVSEDSSGSDQKITSNSATSQPK
jgi:hypothetical protein